MLSSSADSEGDHVGERAHSVDPDLDRVTLRKELPPLDAAADLDALPAPIGSSKYQDQSSGSIRKRATGLS